jgi:hypothetical protein
VPRKNDALQGLINLQAIMEGVWHEGKRATAKLEKKAPARAKVRQLPETQKN